MLEYTTLFEDYAQKQNMLQREKTDILADRFHPHYRPARNSHPLLDSMPFHHTQQNLNRLLQIHLWLRHKIS